jgi:polysaccharide pyruvyl transferase WcaK-like protein
MQYNFERFLSDADIVMSLGGDNYSLDYNSVNKYLNGNDRVLAAGKPLVIWGASVGPFAAEPEIEARVAEQFKRIALVVARERRTVAYLDSIGVRENVMLLPDPAFSLNTAPAPLPDAQEAMLQAGAIGVNLSPLLARYRNDMHGWLEDATGWVRALMDSSGRPVLLVPHVFEPGNDDQAFMAQILARIGAPVDRLALLDGRDLSCMQLKQVISRLHVFIGARTHATIAAMSRGVPTLSIGYSVKARGINEEVFSSTEWMVSHQGLDAATLVERYRTLDENAEQVREALAQRLIHYRMTAQDIRDFLARAIP